MTSYIFIEWLDDVVVPYLRETAGALIVDDYTAHWTPEVQEACEQRNIQLIRVPSGCTTEYQPLDVQFNGPMAKARQKIWRENRAVRPDSSDSHQLAVERAQQAYQSISKANTRKAWVKAWLVDE